MKSLLLVFITMVLFIGNNYGQQKVNASRQINQLKYAYFNSNSDSAKLNRLNSLIEAYFDLSDLKNTLLYNQQLKLLSRKLKTSNAKAYRLSGVKAEASYYNHVGKVLQKQGNYIQANTSFFRSLHLYTSINDKNNMGIILSNISATFSGIGNYTQSLE
jgi:tetratricopeptide (TPR) repeat protein